MNEVPHTTSIGPILYPCSVRNFAMPLFVGAAVPTAAAYTFAAVFVAGSFASSVAALNTAARFAGTATLD